MSEAIKTYKGTDKDLQCRGYQFELGRKEVDTGAVRCGDKGFHACEAPFDVLRYYPLNDGNRYFESESGGIIDRTCADDSKLASSELTLKAEIGLPGIIKAQIAYTRKKAESGESGGYRSNLAGGGGSNLAGGNYSNLAGGDESNLAGGNYSNLAGGNYSNLAGGDESNLAGGNYSNLAGGNYSNLAGGDESNLAGGDESNLAGGDYSNLAGGDESNLAGGNYSNLAGGDESNLAGGDESNLAGGDRSIIIGRNGCKEKGGKNSVIVLTEWDFKNGEYVPVSVKTEIVDGHRIKADTYYRLEAGEFVEAEE